MAHLPFFARCPRRRSRTPLRHDSLLHVRRRTPRAGITSARVPPLLYLGVLGVGLAVSWVSRSLASSSLNTSLSLPFPRSFSLSFSVFARSFARERPHSAQPSSQKNTSNARLYNGRVFPPPHRRKPRRPLVASHSGRCDIDVNGLVHLRRDTDDLQSIDWCEINYAVSFYIAEFVSLAKDRVGMPTSPPGRFTTLEPASGRIYV